MASNFDLNLPILNYESEVLFDLNEIPPSEEDLNEEFPSDNGHSIENDQGPNLHGTRRNLSNEERWKIYHALLEKRVGGKFKKSDTKEISNQFSVSTETVRRVWKRAIETSNNGRVDVCHRRTGNSGRKRISVESSQIQAVPFQKRTTFRTFSEALKVSPTTLFRRMKEGLIRRHTNSIKPHLKVDNLRIRLQFCMSMLDKNTLPHEPKFIDMYNIVHIDEKWFYMTKKSEKYYLLPTEEEPQRTCQSKNYIGKVMFLAAMARPRFDGEGKEVFSGKIGIFPFVTMEPAKRRSKNRAAGTLELKAKTSVKREDIKSCLIEKVLPAIREKWPSEDRSKVIYIQQDNARTHVDRGDKEFQEAASENGFDIRLMCQPPNSPDLNILDLGFFSAIQSLQHKECPKTIEDLVHAVGDAFEKYPSKKVNHIFLTLQSCMREIMRIGGSNKYKLSHMKKATLERENILPIQLNCDALLVQNVMNILSSSD